MVDNKVQFYGFGNTLLLSPIFRIFNNAYILDGALRFVNTILIVLSACISYYILKNIFKADSRKALFIACASVSFMEVLKNAGAIVNESSLFLWCWIVLLCILLLARNVIEERGSLKHKIISGIFGVVLAYGSLIHIRHMVVYIAVIVTIIVFCFLYKKLLINLISFIPTYAVSYFAAKLLLKYVLLNLWSYDGTGEKLGNSSDRVFSKASKILEIFTFDGMKTFIKSFLSQLTTVTIQSFGMFWIVMFGVVWLIIYIIKYRKDANKKNECMYLSIVLSMSIVCFLGMMALTDVISMQHIELNDNKWLIYSRYYSAFIGPFIMCGLYGISKSQNRVKIILTNILATMLSYIVILRVWMNLFINQNVSVSGNYYWMAVYCFGNNNSILSKKTFMPL